MKKILFSSFLLVWLVGNSATFRPAPVQPMSPAIANDTDEKGCFLPSVKGIQIISTSGTTLTVVWNPTQGAAYFRIKAYDGVNNALVRNFLVVAKPSDNTVVLQDLIPGVLYSVYVSAVCANGQESL